MTQVAELLLEEGRQEGRQEGRREGRQEGRQEADRRTARNMLKRGDSLEAIAEVLELPTEVIRAWELDEK